ncbi:cation diffusion facilitator family transporter [Rhodococcus koreensis]
MVAFSANVGVAIAKSVAATVTGSASMVAEAAHSWADTGNQVFLLIANRRSARAADAHRPLGYGREAYVWSLLAAVGLFVAGGTVSVWHGLTELLHEPDTDEDYLIAYLVLAVAFVLEGTSLLRAIRQLRGEAHNHDRDVLDYALETSDPTVRAVFVKDSAAIVGFLIAAAAIALHQITGTAVWDATGSILVGVLLGAVAVVLIDRNRRFLLVASVDLVGDHAESHIAHTLRKLEQELERNPHIVDAVLTVADPGEQDVGTDDHDRP